MFGNKMTTVIRARTRHGAAARHFVVKAPFPGLCISPLAYHHTDVPSFSRQPIRDGVSFRRCRKPHRFFSVDAFNHEREMSESVDPLDIQTSRIIHCFETNSPECGMIELNSIDSIMTQLAEKAASPEWGRKAADLSLKLLDAIEGRIGLESSDRFFVSDAAMYNVVLKAYASSFNEQSLDRREIAELATHLLDRMISRARESHHRPNQSPAPTTITFNSVLNVWAKSELPDAGKRAEEIFAKMENWLLECQQLDLQEAPPNERTLCTVMDAWIKSGAQGFAERVTAILEVAIDRQKRVRRGENSGYSGWSMKPNIVMFNTAIHAWGAGNRLDGQSLYAPRKAEQLLQLMTTLNESGELSSIHDYDDDDDALAPFTRSFNLVLNAWAKAAKEDQSGQCAERAEKILKEMIRQYRINGDNVKPDARSFGVCIKAWSRSTRHPHFAARAHDIYDEMVNLYREFGDPEVKPDSWACNSVISAWAKTRTRDSAERAEKVLDGMREFLEPDVFCYNAVINAFAKTRNVRKAREILSMLENQNSVKPDTVSYNTVLNALSQDPHGAPDAENLLFRMMKEKNVDPNVISYTCVINAWGINRHFRKNGAERAAMIFEMMLKKYEEGNESLKPDLRAFNSVINASLNAIDDVKAREAAVKFALTTFHLMKDRAVFDPPDHWTYTAIFRVCSRNVFNASERLDLLERYLRQCVDDGMLNTISIEILQHGMPLSLQRKFSIEFKNPSVPPSWCRYVPVRARLRPSVLHQSEHISWLASMRLLRQSNK